MIKKFLPNVFLVVWSIAALGATVTHVLFTERVASASAWGLAAGWQREIGFFDLILASSALYSVYRSDRVLKKYLCFMLPTLSIFLGANHFYTFLKTDQILHLQWASLNALAVLSGYSSLLILKAE